METKPKTWMPTAAGILNIIVGSLRLLVFLGVIIAIIVLGTASQIWNQIESEVFPLTLQAIVGILIVVAVFLVAAGTLSLIGGIADLQRKRWGLALAGSIASMLGPVFLGIFALIFTAISRQEFE